MLNDKYRIKDADLNYISHLQNLQHLRIFGLKHISRLQNLQHLEIPTCYLVTNIGFKHISCLQNL